MYRKSELSTAIATMPMTGANAASGSSQKTGDGSARTSIAAAAVHGRASQGNASGSKRGFDGGVQRRH